MWWKVDPPPKGLPRQSCVKSSVAPQRASCQALTLCGFLWLSFPLEFCLEPKGSNGNQNSKPNSAPSNHFPLFHFSALFPPFLKARHTQANLGLPPKTPQPQLVTLKTQIDQGGVRLPELPGSVGKNCLIASFLLLSSLYPLWVLPETREVNQSHDGLLQRYVVISPCPVMARL